MGASVLILHANCHRSIQHPICVWFGLFHIRITSWGVTSGTSGKTGFGVIDTVDELVSPSNCGLDDEH